MVGQSPLPSEQSWQARVSGREARKVDLWAPRTTRGSSRAHHSPFVSVSCRSGPCGPVSMPEAWGALAWTPPQPPPWVKEQRRLRPGPEPLERQMLSSPPGHSHQLMGTNDPHAHPFFLDCNSSLGAWLPHQALPVFTLTLSHWM